jgi:hypothetical protein
LNGIRVYPRSRHFKFGKGRDKKANFLFAIDITNFIKEKPAHSCQFLCRDTSPKNDLVFKKIFGHHPELLKSFLNALFE